MSHEPVLFYGRSRPFFEFSNWYVRRFTYRNVVWKTSEHLFMAFKTLNPEHQEIIRLAPTAAKAKELAGPGGIIELRPDWEDVKLDMMVEANMPKYEQHQDLRDLLVSTYPRPIHEDCADRWWGGGPNYPKGKDLLGKALTEVRHRLMA